jgi:hypothetical protein
MELHRLCSLSRRLKHVCDNKNIWDRVFIEKFIGVRVPVNQSIPESVTSTKLYKEWIVSSSMSKYAFARLLAFSMRKYLYDLGDAVNNASRLIFMWKDQGIRIWRSWKNHAFIVQPRPATDVYGYIGHRPSKQVVQFLENHGCSGLISPGNWGPDSYYSEFVCAEEGIASIDLICALLNDESKVIYDHYRSESVLVKSKCTFCVRVAELKCSACELPFCSEECQISDHGKSCLKIYQ